MALQELHFHKRIDPEQHLRIRVEVEREEGARDCRELSVGGQKGCKGRSEREAEGKGASRLPQPLLSLLWQ